MMYNPPTFMTMQVLQGILSEFTWPAPYTLEESLPDGIWMLFPQCSIEFTEGFESEIDLRFSVEETQTPYNLTLFHAIQALRADPNYVMPPSPKLIKYFSPGASLEKVQAGIRDTCTLVLTYLTPFLLGDRSWIVSYKKHVAAGP